MKNTTTILDDLKQVFIKAGCDDLLTIIERANPLETGVDFLTCSEDDDFLVLYTPIIKKPKESNKSQNQKAIKTRIGRLINKYVKAEEHLKEIESLNGILTGDCYYFKEIKGEEIREVYSGDYNSELSGSLHTSCMNGCPPEYFDYYVHNCRMLLLIDKTASEEYSIAGRALLWDSVDVIIDGRKKKQISFMDRVYSCTSVYSLFAQYAKDNGYYTRQNEMMMTSDIEFTSPDGEIIKNSKDSFLEVKESHKYLNYPHMDTFAFTDDTDLNSYNGDIMLKEVDGNYRGADRIECFGCGKSIRSNTEVYYTFTKQNPIGESQPNHICYDCFHDNF